MWDPWKPQRRVGGHLGRSWMGRGPLGRSGTGQGIIGEVLDGSGTRGEVLDGSGTLGEVRDGSGDPRGGPKGVEGPSGKSGTGRGTLVLVRDG